MFKTTFYLKQNVNLEDERELSFPFLSTSFYKSHAVYQPGSERLVTMHQLLHKEVCLAPPFLLWSRWDWQQLCAPGFPDNSQILRPLCGCQEQRALMIAHCHWSRARNTQDRETYKNQGACGDEGDKQKWISVFFRHVSGAVYQPSTIRTLLQVSQKDLF